LKLTASFTAVARRKIMDERTHTNVSTQPRGGRRRWLWLLAILPVTIAVGIGAVQTYALAGPFGLGPAASPEQHKAMMERRLERALSVVKATDSQRTAIKAIFARAFAELGPIHQEKRRLHDDFVAAFAADPVDRAAVERLRTQATALVDRGSQSLSKALLDAASVLTPEQRKALVEHLRELPARGPGHGRWRWQ
jgi:protein CpxP